LPKPIDRPRLIRAIAEHVGKKSAAAEQPPCCTGEVPSGGSAPLVSQFADDPDIATILDGFIERLGGQVSAMREALAQGRYVELQRMAHNLKGSGGNYGYPALTETAKVLEDAAKARSGQAADRAIVHLALLCEAVEKGQHVSLAVGGNT